MIAIGTHEANGKGGSIVVEAVQGPLKDFVLDQQVSGPLVREEERQVRKHDPWRRQGLIHCVDGAPKVSLRTFKVSFLK